MAALLLTVKVELLVELQLMAMDYNQPKRETLKLTLFHGLMLIDLLQYMGLL